MNESASETASLNDFMPKDVMGNAMGDVMGGAMGRASAQRANLIGLDLDGLHKVVSDMGEPAFRAKQLYNWIYARGVVDFDQMTNISKGLRATLSEKYCLSRPAITAHQVSKDGTQKWLLRYEDGNEAETVFIPEEDRGTLCISSQVGCSLTCSFCHTGTQKLVRNLTPGDIAGQVMLARDALGDWDRTENGGRRLTNIVLMGMGEPLYNTDHVIAAMRLVSDGDGIAIGRRKITVSTSGVVPELQRIGEALGLSLAISLHAVEDRLRNELVPINRKYPIEQLIRSVKAYPGLTPARRATWEYVMLKGVNDSDEAARKLITLIDGIPSKINLIPFNPWPGSAYECSDPERIERFLGILHRAGMVATIRKTRGQDILAACGQLKSESERIGKRARMRLEAIRAEKEAAVGL